MRNRLARLIGGGEITFKYVRYAGRGFGVVEAGVRRYEIGDIVPIIGHEHYAIRNRMGEYCGGFGLVDGVFSVGGSAAATEEAVDVIAIRFESGRVGAR